MSGLNLNLNSVVSDGSQQSLTSQHTASGARTADSSSTTVVWARQQKTPDLGKPEILSGAPSANNLERRLLYRI